MGPERPVPLPPGGLRKRLDFNAIPASHDPSRYPGFVPPPDNPDVVRQGRASPGSTRPGRGAIPYGARRARDLLTAGRANQRHSSAELAGIRRRPAPSRRNRSSPSNLGPHGQCQSRGQLHHRLGDRSPVLAHDLATRLAETPLHGHAASLAPARRISGSVTAAPTPEVTVRRCQDLCVPNLEENRGESVPRSGELSERICIRCREERSDTAAAGSARPPWRPASGCQSGRRTTWRQDRRSHSVSADPGALATHP